MYFYSKGMRNRWWVILYFLLVKEVLQLAHMALRLRRIRAKSSQGEEAALLSRDSAKWRMMVRKYEDFCVLSIANSWHVTLCKNISNARLAWAEGSYVGHVFRSKPIITFTLFRKTSKADRLIVVQRRVWSTTSDQTGWACISNLFA